MFRKAERQKAKVRIGLSGSSGSGKTYSALLIAFGLGGKVAFIDTENGSGDLYAHLGDYDIARITAPFTPEKYVSAIKGAEQAGYSVIIIDSLSHAWAGEGGLLDQQGKIADSGKGNSYTAWRTVTPKHNQLVESMLQSTCHIIATTRAKTEYVIEKNSSGKDAPKKVGMAPVQREGLEYEFTIALDISGDHIATPSKDRTTLFDGQYFKPSIETGKKLLEWFNSGKDADEKSSVNSQVAEKQEAPASSPGSPAPSVDGELPNPKDVLIGRMSEFKNSFEAKNWKAKHQATIDSLPAAEKGEVMKIYFDILKELNSKGAA